MRLHVPRALGEIAIPLEVARCANRSTARRWRQIRDATPGGKSKQDRTSLRRRGKAAGERTVGWQSCACWGDIPCTSYGWRERRGGFVSCVAVRLRADVMALSYCAWLCWDKYRHSVCGSPCASRERHCARFGRLRSEKFSMFAFFGLEFDTSQQESLGLFNTTQSELTETSNWAWDVNA